MEDLIQAKLRQSSSDVLLSIIQSLIVYYGSNCMEKIHQKLIEYEKMTELSTIPNHSSNASSLEESIPNYTNYPENSDEPRKKKIKVARPFDISKYRQRQIAFQLQYEGGSYYGFASQEIEETIERYFFNALIKLRLIESRQTCNYSRCGRTDKGVSAFGQVISVRLRSNFPSIIPSENIPKHPNDCLIISEDKPPIYELDYITLINKSLPENIRVLGWSEVTSEFNARFSATYRTYRYFFVKRNLNIDAMKYGASLLIGSHDFRNFCKLDVENVTNFIREIYSAEIRPVMNNNMISFDSPISIKDDNSLTKINIDDMTVYVFEIQGIAFLWHMVRCIMAILFLIGEEKESPEIITTMLNIDLIPSKPQYNIASELPLVLHQCGFENLSMQWQVKNLWNLSIHFQSILDRHLIAAARAKNAFDELKNMNVRGGDVNHFLDQLLLNKKENLEINHIEDNERKKNRDCLMTTTTMTSSDIMNWGDAMNRIQSMGVYLVEDNLPYIPLIQRQRQDDYETKCQKLEGNKKERYNRHVELRSNGSSNDPSFFEKMRKEGSIK